MTHSSIPAGYTVICRPYITVKGKRIYAWQKGKKAFCFPVPTASIGHVGSDAPAANESLPEQGELELASEEPTDAQ